MAKGDNNSLNYIGIIRLSDRCLLASYPDAPPKESRKEIQSIFDKIYKDSDKNIKNNSKKYLSITNGKFFFITNSLKTIILFVFSKDTNFPRRIASKLLKEYAETIDSNVGEENLSSAKKYSLNSKLKNAPIELLAKYSDYKKQDPTTKAKENVEGILDHFSEDVNKLIESYGNIEDLKSKSVQLQEQAAKFSNTSTAAKKSYRRQYISHIIILIVIMLVIVLYLTIPFFTNASETTPGEFVNNNGFNRPDYNRGALRG